MVFFYVEWDEAFEMGLTVVSIKPPSSFPCVFKRNLKPKFGKVRWIYLVWPGSGMLKSGEIIVLIMNVSVLQFIQTIGQRS